MGSTGRNGTNPIHVIEEPTSSDAITDLSEFTRVRRRSWLKRASDEVTMTHVILVAALGLLVGGWVAHSWVGDLVRYE